jgi:hypothetical protein
LIAATDFLAGDKRILLIVASGGAGKSRFLRALADVARRASVRRTSWARRPEVGTIEGGLRGGIPVARPILLALDDAGRALADATRLALATSRGKDPKIDVKVVLAARTADREAIETKLATLGDIAYATLELSPLGTDVAAGIAQHECSGLTPDDARRLARHFGSNLFLLRAAAQFVRAGKSPTAVVQQGALRNLVAAAFVKEAGQRLTAIGQEAAAARILFDTALDVPIRADDCSTEQATLCEAGLLRTVGTTIRFRADVEGDLILGYLLEQPWARASLKRNLSANPDALLPRLRNLAAAGSGHPADTVRATCEAWIANADTTERWPRQKILSVLPHCIPVAPDLVISLCIAYARAFDTHRTDDFGPVVVALARHGKPVESIRLLRQLAEVGVPDGMYSNYKVEGASQEIASLRYLTPDCADRLIDEFSSWLDVPVSQRTAEILQAALKKVLSPTLSRETSERATATFHERPIAVTPTVLALRSRVMTLVETMLAHPERHVRAAAAHVLLDHAHTVGGGVVPNPDLKHFQTAEFLKIVPALEKRLATELDMSVLATLEEALVFRWATMRPAAHEAGRILLSTRWPALLAAFRMTTRSRDFYVSIAEVMADAPEAERWSWWVGRRHSRTMDGLPLIEIGRVIDALLVDHPGTAGLVHVMRVLDGVPLPEILEDRWCRRDQALFSTTLTDSSADLSEAARHRLERTLRRRSFSEPSFDPVEEMRRRIVDGEPLSLLQEVFADTPFVPPQGAAAIIRLLVHAPELDRRRFGVSILQYRNDIPRDVAFELLKIALRDGLWTHAWGSIWSILHGSDSLVRADSSLLDTLENRLVEVLESDDWYGRGNEEWHVDEVLKIIVGPDLNRRQRLVERVVFTKSSWRLTVAKLAAPLIANVRSLEILLRALGALIEYRELSTGTCAQLLGGAVAQVGVPSEALNLVQKLLDDPSSGVPHVSVIALAEMRQTPSAADACAALAEIAARDGAQREHAERALPRFATPRGGHTSAVGEAPPAFLRIQEMLVHAARKVKSSGARKHIAALRRSVVASIENLLHSDEEFLDPR